MWYHYNHPTTPAGSLKPNLTQLERIDLKLKNIFCTATWMWQKKCRCKSRKQLRVKEAGYIYRLDNELHFMHGPYGCRFFIRSRSKRGCLKYLHAFEVSPPPCSHCCTFLMLSVLPWTYCILHVLSVFSMMQVQDTHKHGKHVNITISCCWVFKVFSLLLRVKDEISGSNCCCCCPAWS